MSTIHQATVEHSIVEKLQAEFQPLHLEVLNESHQHSVPANSETHFKAVIVSQSFVDLIKVKRHQAVYAILAEELAGPVHALALHTYTPSEWQSVAEQAPDSPACASKQ